MSYYDENKNTSNSFLFAHSFDSIPDKSERKNAIYEKLTPLLLGMYGSGGQMGHNQTSSYDPNAIYFPSEEGLTASLSLWKKDWMRKNF